METGDSPKPAGLEGAVRLVGADGDAVAALLERLRGEDALGQLVERRDALARLAPEADDAKLDRVDGVAWALDHPGVPDEPARRVAAPPAGRPRHPARGRT